MKKWILMLLKSLLSRENGWHGIAPILYQIFLYEWNLTIFLQFSFLYLIYYLDYPLHKHYTLLSYSFRTTELLTLSQNESPAHRFSRFQLTNILSCDLSHSELPGFSRNFIFASFRIVSGSFRQLPAVSGSFLRFPKLSGSSRTYFSSYEVTYT